MVLGCRVGEGERPRGVSKGLRGVLGRLLSGAEVVAGSVTRSLRLVSGVAPRGLAIGCSLWRSVLPHRHCAHHADDARRGETMGFRQGVKTNDGTALKA